MDKANTNMEFKTTDTESTEPSEFVKLLDAFEEQLIRMETHAEVILSQVERIYPDIQPEKQPDSEQLNRSGIIGELWERVNRMDKYNECLQKSRDRLNDIVG